MKTVDDLRMKKARQIIDRVGTRLVAEKKEAVSKEVGSMAFAGAEQLSGKDLLSNLSKASLPCSLRIT